MEKFKNKWKFTSVRKWFLRSSVRHFKGVKIQPIPFFFEKKEFWSNKRMSGEEKKTQKDMGQKECFWSFLL